MGQAPHRAPSFKHWTLNQATYDLSRFLFLGRVLPEQLADVLRLSDLHIYSDRPLCPLLVAS